MPLRVINIIPQARSAETNFDSEPSIAVNPANPQQIVISAFTPDTATPVTTGPYFFSTDGGATWALNSVIPGGTTLLGTADISVRFAASGILYAGILRGDTGAMNILRKANFGGPGTMAILLTRTPEDQPWVEAITQGGVDRVYVGSNDISQRPSGQTASIDFSQNAATAAAPAGFTTTARLESRASATLPPSTGGSQDGPSVRVAIHPSGVLYGVFFGWRTFGSPNVSDIVVVRDDNLASGTTQFQALSDPAPPAGDGNVGLRVATGVNIAPLGTLLGTQRIGSSLTIAVDPLDSQRVYIAWCDGLATTASPYTLRVRRSDDGGQTWTGDLFTRENATNPGLAVNARGTVALLFQELVTTAGSPDRWQTHLVKSLDQFQAVFSDDVLADVLDSSTGAKITVIIGDYDNLLALGKDFYGVFSAHNKPDTANFPARVTYLRNANFGTKTLLAVDKKTTVSPSVDPFFFHDQALEPVNGISYLSVAPLSDKRLEFWLSDGASGLLSTWKTTTDPNANWTPWADFLAEVGPLANGARQLAVAPLPDGRLELWVSDGAGGLWSTWKTTTDPNANWSGWADFLAEVGPLANGARQLAVAPLPDGRSELWVSDGAGGLWSTWKTTTDPNANWSGWADFLAEI
jgi:hypothetical protein